jgi:two-component system chemotaxis sensor kinase CheA
MGTSLDGMEEIIEEFAAEALELLDDLERTIVALEEEPARRELIDRTFRVFHTIKGTSAFLGFTRIERVTHAAESLLAGVRDEGLALAPAEASLLLAAGDAVRTQLGVIAASGAESDDGAQALVDRLEAARASQLSPATARHASPLPQAHAHAAAGPPEGSAGLAAASTPVTAAETFAAAPATLEAAPVAEGGPETSVRVGVELLDRLMNLVGELVLARNRLVQQTEALQDSPIMATAERIDLITSELQEEVMKTRMQAIGTVWARLPRIVRDLSGTLGKRVRLDMVGRETELDRTLLEAIRDPLVHVVRNALDHGLETPEERAAAGKNAEGALNLRAWHEGGLVNIEVTDDGRGIDPERVLAKARAKGLLPADRLAAMSERELTELIFLPGFSTREVVTGVSGRGVGMDVVKSNVEAIGGVVELNSRKGHGTTLRLKIPLTLAIIPAVVVVADGDRYAIPQGNLLELVRVSAEDPHGVESVRGAPVYRLRGQLLPLLHLNDVLGLPAGEPAEEPLIVVLQADGNRFGLIVDDVVDTEEIVVKPLGAQLGLLDMFSGATIMGDGSVALILDVFAIGRAYGVNVAWERIAEARNLSDSGAPGELVVVAALAGDMRFALPLSRISRIEVLEAPRVERIGPNRVVLYRGQLLPLFDLGQLVGEEPPSELADPLHVLVCTQGDGSVGLVVERVVDIAEAFINPCARQELGPAIDGLAVIDGRVTRVVDPRLAFDWIRLPRLGSAP